MSSRPASVASHHSDAVQLASKLADALQYQLKQACDRQQRLDKERQDERTRADSECAAAYEREQHDRQALLDREDRQRQLAIEREDMQRARKRSDLLELADDRARAATLELELQHLRDAAAAAPPVPPVVNTLVAPPAPDTFA